MGRGKSGSGLEVHGDRIRIRFTFNGKRYAEPLRLPPTASNIKAAERIAREIKQKISLGVFDYADTFPNSKNVQAAASPETITVSAYTETWLKTLTNEKSTLLGYKSAMSNFWLPQIGALAVS